MPADPVLDIARDCGRVEFEGTDVLGPMVADEAVSMLDPSEQAKMIELLKHLQVERGMSMIFIFHDLAVVVRIADVSSFSMGAASSRRAAAARSSSRHSTGERVRCSRRRVGTCSCAICS